MTGVKIHTQNAVLCPLLMKKLQVYTVEKTAKA